MKRIGLEWQVFDTPLQLEEVSAPATPPSNIVRVYAKDKAGASALYLKDDAGSEREIGPANAVTGTGASGRLAFWTGTSTIGSSANFLWNDSDTRLHLFVAGANSGLHIERSNGQANFNGYRITGSATVADALLAIFAGGGSHTGLSADRVVTSLFGVYAGEAWTSTAKGSYLTLETTPLLSTTRAERFRIGPSGQFGIGGATFGTAGQAFLSGGASAAPAWTSLDHGTHLAGLSDDDHPQYVLHTEVDDTPVDGEDDVPISSNWAFDHVAAADPHTGYRLESADHSHQSTGAQAGQLDHGAALTGLTDDDHTIYALLAGRSGGQTLIGGTGVADDLILRATAGIGAGSEEIIFQGGNNGATELARFNSAGVGFYSAASSAIRAEIFSNGSTNRTTALSHFADDSNPAVMTGRKSRGTSFGSFAAVQSGDILFVFQANGSDGSAFLGASSQLRFEATENFSSGNQGAQFAINTVPNGSGSLARRVTVGNQGNVRIGANAISSNGTLVLEFDDGTAPTSMGSNTAGLYAEDVAGTVEMFAIDEAGNDTQISPHGFTLFTPDESYELPWSYRSQNRYIGKRIEVDMFGVVRALEQLTGKKFIYLADLPASEVRDWQKDQEENFRKAVLYKEWYDNLSDKEKVEHTAPRAPVRKDPPAWIATRMKQRSAVQ